MAQRKEIAYVNLIDGPEILDLAADLARKGLGSPEVYDTVAAQTGLLRSYVADFLRRNQSAWLAS